MNLARIHTNDGKINSVPLKQNGRTWYLPLGEIPENASTVEFNLEGFSAPAGEDGYYLIPTMTERNRPSGIVRFSQRGDSELAYRSNDMAVFGVNHGKSGKFAVVSGMGLTYTIVFGVKDSTYYIYPRFHFDIEKRYEDPAVTIFDLDENNCNWNGMARTYRKYQLDRGACVTLRERAKKFPVLDEAARGPEVRVRLAWKPVPPPVLEQTPENEPEVHCAITLKRAGEILDMCHKKGIRHAEFCLVGWNIGGHDGRFPDLFPVEPKIGTMDDLKALIAKARAYGYLICCHTNVLDSYSVSKRWSRNDVLHASDGSERKGGCWGGGQSYFLCPKEAHNHYAVQDFDDLANIGFRGTHYLDVMSIFEPIACYNPAHPLNPREAGEWRGKTMKLAREKLGASGSEGGLDFMVGDFDYVLYSLFELNPKKPDLCDEYVPFWFLVYHGILLYNTSCESVNEMIKKNPETALHNLECGGRPLAYFYSKFRTGGGSWMGIEDMGCVSDEELESCVNALAESAKAFEQRSDLQFEFLETYETVEPGIVRTIYSNGTEIAVNHRDTAFEYKGRTIGPHSFVRIDR